MHKLFRQFSFPGGIPSHVAPETPGSIHEGGELGYALVHAYGAAFDNPDLLVCCVIGDGEAETGPLAASWHSNKFAQPGARRRGAAGAAPQRLQDRQPDGARAHPARTSCARCWRATATRRASSPATTRRPCTRRSPPRSTPRSTRSRRSSAARAREGAVERPRWPMIVLRTPKGWTGPEGGRRPAGRGQLALAPGAARQARRKPGAPARCSRSGCAPTAPRSSSTRTAARATRCSRRRRRASAAWAPIRTPTAACCCATCGFPTSATTPSTSPRRGTGRARRCACSGATCATSCG